MEHLWRAWSRNQIFTNLSSPIPHTTLPGSQYFWIRPPFFKYLQLKQNLETTTPEGGAR